MFPAVRLLDLAGSAGAHLFVDFKANPANRTEVNLLRGAFSRLPDNAAFVVREKTGSF
jgi:hypothetical protein